ncbi:MAG: shikimate kinase [Cyanobacteria bacterium Co-bin13]|nr:shikimate kinase [Cyanobacteria bacterium Co-bin13]
MTNADFLKGTNLYLIGMMGAGKSTTGKRLAQGLGYRFFDTDALIEKAVGQSVAEIFETQGEEAFRGMETQVLSQLAAYTRLVVATGGGIVTQQMNWSYLQHGVVIWLDVPLNLLEQRLQGDVGRPLLQRPDWPQTLQALLSQREPLYAQADLRLTVAAGEDEDAIAARLLTLLQQRVEEDRQERLPNE